MRQSPESDVRNWTTSCPAVLRPGHERVDERRLDGEAEEAGSSGQSAGDRRMNCRSEPAALRKKPIADVGARQLRRDLKLLARFIEFACRRRHSGVEKAAVRLKGYDLHALHGSPLLLCGPCQKLLAHAFVKRTLCPLDPKPSCKKCPTHCYAPRYRAQIREVMKLSGRRFVLRGRLDCLFRLFA